MKGGTRGSWSKICRLNKASKKKKKKLVDKVRCWDARSWSRRKEQSYNSRLQDWKEAQFIVWKNCTICCGVAWRGVGVCCERGQRRRGMSGVWEETWVLTACWELERKNPNKKQPTQDKSNQASLYYSNDRLLPMQATELEDSNFQHTVRQNTMIPIFYASQKKMLLVPLLTTRN